MIEKFSKYPSLQSSITRKNIHSKYSKIDKKQRAIREFLKGVGRLIGRNSKVSSIKIAPKVAKAEIVIKNGSIQVLKNKAESVGLKPKVKNKNTLIVTKAIL